MKCLFKRYTNYIEGHLNIEDYFKNINESAYNLRDWKNKIFITLIHFLVILGIPLMLLSAYKFLSDGFILLSLITISVVVLWFLTIYINRIDLLTKKVVILTSLYLLGVFILFNTGPAGAGLVTISFSLLLSGCIVEKKQVRKLVLFNFIIFFILTLLMAFQLLQAYPIGDYKGSWLINVLTTQGTSLVLLSLMHIIYMGIDNQNSRIKASKQALQSNEIKYKDMMGNIFDVITILDEKGIIIYKSPNIKNLFGWDSAALLGQNILDYIHKDDLETAKEALIEMHNYPIKKVVRELRYRKASGDYVYIELTGANLPNHPSIKGILANYRDITGQKNSEAALLKAKETAEAATFAKGQFLSLMSHEIRTPLNGIMGMQQLLKMTKLTEEQENYLSISSLASHHLLTLINDILDYSKIGASKIALEITEINIYEIVEEVKNLFSAQIKDKKLSSTFNIAKNIPLILLGDGHRIKQILFNLMGNAIKFTEVGGVKLNVAIIKTKDNMVMLQWSIQDTGIGLTLNQTECIFDVFNQGELSITRRYGGTGLGLSICKGLVNLMNGDIWVKSIKGQGSEFCFTCILEIKNPVDIKDEPLVTAAHEAIKVLIAEDDAFSLFLLEKMGEKLNWLMVLVDNGKKAVKAFEKEDFDIILMDVNMPIMDGIEATELIREKDKTIPIIAVSAFALAEEKELYLKYGMTDFISKPVNMKTLNKIVSKWV